MTHTYPDFWAWYPVRNGPLDAAHDQVLASRLVDGKALTQNLTVLREAYKEASRYEGVCDLKPSDRVLLVRNTKIWSRVLISKH